MIQPAEVENVVSLGIEHAIIVENIAGGPVPAVEQAATSTGSKLGLSSKWKAASCQNSGRQPFRFFRRLLAVPGDGAIRWKEAQPHEPMSGGDEL